MIESKVHSDATQKVSVAFADDNDVVTGSKDAEENVNVITTDFNNLRTATGDCIEEK